MAIAFALHERPNALVLIIPYHTLTINNKINNCLNIAIQCSALKPSWILLKIRESSDVMWLSATCGILVHPWTDHFHWPSFVCVETLGISWHSAEYLFQCLSLHLFHTPVFTPPGIIMLQVNKYVLSTSLQKWAKQVFFNHHSTYTVNTSHACLLSFNWDITSEAKSLLNYTDTINPFTFCLASKATIAFWRWEELVVQSNDRKISPAWRRKTKTWRKWNICHPILRCPDAP